MRSLNIRNLPRRHICSVRGCGNKDTVFFTRSGDLVGGIYICRDCVAGLAAHYGIIPAAPEDAAPETVEETARVRRGKGKGAAG